MSNSKLVDVTIISPNSTARTAKIDTITIHHMACKATADACGASFLPTSRKASSNYGIGYDGKVGLYVPENRRSWCSSSYENDNRAITIEVSNDGREPDWHVPDAALNKLIDLCVDICQRNGIPRLNFTGDTTGNLTMHKWFQHTLCPGPYLESKFPWIAEEVNRRLSGGGNTDTPEKENTVPGAAGAPQYRVQVGAFTKRTGAENRLSKVKSAGFNDVFMVSVDDRMYRVQVGPYAQRKDAEAQQAKLKDAGINGFVTTLGGHVICSELKVGSVVRLKQGAKTIDGESLASFVYDRDHVVKSIDGNRLVITFGGVVVAAVKKEDVTVKG